MGEVLTLADAVRLRDWWREQDVRVVLTNGHFDLLHVGHLDYLEKARDLGGALIVGVNGDASSAALKGAGRPLVPAVERARLLAALAPVDVAVIFDETTAHTLVRALAPDVYVKGGDYRHNPPPERETAHAVGAAVLYIDYLPDHSTSRLIQRIRAL